MEQIAREARSRAPGARSQAGALGAAAWVGCGLATLAAFGQLTALGANGALLSSLTAFGELVLAALVLMLFAADMGDDHWRDLIAPMLLLTGALAWTLAAKPLSPEAAQRELLKLAGAAAACLVGFLIGLRRRRAGLFVDMMVAAGGFYLLFCLALRQVEPFTVFGHSKGAHMWRFSGTLLNANGAAVVFGGLALIAMAHMLSAFRQIPVLGAQTANLLRAGGSGVVAFVAAGGCAMTGSRVGFAALLLLGVAVLLLDRPIAGRQAGWKAWAPKAAMLVLLAAGVVLGGEPLLGRSTAYSADFAARLQGYGLYTALLAQAPLTGWGLGSFYLLNQASLDASNAAGLWSFGSAHCAPLQAAVEGGWPYLALLVAVFAVITFRIISGWTRIARSNIAGVGFVAASLLVVGASLVDIALNIPAVGNLMLLGVGLLWSRAIPPKRRPAP